MRRDAKAGGTSAIGETLGVMRQGDGKTRITADKLIMGQLIYEDTTRKYFLLDYSPSHSELVIRAFIDKNKNIDLFFKNVETINLTPKLDGIKITTNSKKTDDNFTFTISDNAGNTGFIHAGLFVEFNNDLDMLQTSLGDFTWTIENKEISSFPVK